MASSKKIAFKSRQDKDRIKHKPNFESYPLKEDISKLSEISLKKRRQIINAAIECFLELGYQGTSMNAVAERAQVIKQTIYSHFDDKETLFKSVIQAVTLDYVRNELDSPNMTNKSSTAKLSKIAETILKRHEDPRYQKFYRTMIGEIGRFPELAELFIEATVKPGTILVTSLLSNKSEFRIIDPEAFARVFVGSLINYCMQQYTLRGKEFFPFDQKRILKEIMRLVSLHKRN
jgi:TetR/AcrR family transcriptional regulator of autoinduction and epiphytic fitness